MNPRIGSGVGSPQSVFRASATKSHPLGTRGWMEDGRVFYYASNAGAAIAIGSLLQTAAEVGNHTSVAYASGGAIGSTSVTVTLGATAATAQQYRDGFLTVIDGTGQGQIRKIRSHPAAALSSTLEVEVYDPFEIAIASGAEISLAVSPYDSLIVTPGDSQALTVAGVPQCAVGAGTSDVQYFWAQTYGPALVLGDGSTFTEGAPCVPASAGTGDAGQITLGSESDGTGASNDPSDLHPLVGNLLEIYDNSDGDHRYVDLRVRA